MSIIHNFSGNKNTYGWKGVEPVMLSEDGLKAITKYVLIGDNENAPNYIMRYFRIEPGGHSKLERHPQEHEVIILHGKGEVQIAEKVSEISSLDVVFIEGNELHQFSASKGEPLGFLCIIPKP